MMCSSASRSPWLLTPWNYFSCGPRSIIGSFCKCFLFHNKMNPQHGIRVTRQQCTLHRFGYNFLCIVLMVNRKWLHGSLPNLTTASRACGAWCMSGGVEATRLYLAAVFPSKRWLLGLDLTFLLDWKIWVWVSEFLWEEGSCWCPENGATLCSAVAHCLILAFYYTKGDEGFLLKDLRHHNLHIPPIRRRWIFTIWL